MTASARPVQQPASAPAGDALSRKVLLTLGSLTAVAPLVTDMYLPALPDLARSLGTSDALAQLSMSVTLVGLALGQLVVGPLSDRVGRLAPLRWGVLVLAVTSFLCALSGNVAVLLILRLAQGLSGAAALVIARAIVRDLCSGARAAKVFSELMLVMGLAPVVGPVLGGQMLRFTDWRGIFVTLGILSRHAARGMSAGAHRDPADPSGSAGHLPASAFRSLLTHRQFLGFMAVSAMLGTVLFTYISMSSFVLRDEYGLGPVAYSCVFGGNAVGMIVGSQVNARLVGARGPAIMLRRALTVTGVATTPDRAGTGHPRPADPSCSCRSGSCWRASAGRSATPPRSRWLPTDGSRARPRPCSAPASSCSAPRCHPWCPSAARPAVAMGADDGGRGRSAPWSW